VLYDAARVAGERNRKSSSLLLPRMPHAADCSPHKERRLATTSTLALIDQRTGLGGREEGIDRLVASGRRQECAMISRPEPCCRIEWFLAGDRKRKGPLCGVENEKIRETLAICRQVTWLW
jgi:hypothetical protein